jgi:hypothetical protein
MSLTLDEPVAKKPSKPAAKAAPKPENRKPVVLQMRGSEEWRTWVEGLARKEGHSLAKLFEMGVRRIAKDVGYPDAPPR